MATNTPLQSISLTSATSTVTFSNIDQTYTDLVLVASTRSLYNGTNDALFITINGDSSALYSRTEMYNSSVGRASSETAFKYHGKIAGATSNAGTFGTSTINFMNYSNATTYKTLIARCGMADSTYSEVKMSTGLYRSTSAITSMAITSESGTSFVAGSTFDLYGINSGAPKAMGGDLVTTDGNYWYHTFRSSGTFLLQQPTSVDYLVVAGGGGGGSGASSGGGGGAGGYRTSIGGSTLSVSAASYTVTVGAGGSGGTSSTGAGTQGSNSTFSSITSTGGGYGSSQQAPGSVTNGGAGGSGGGAGGYGGGGGTGLTGGAASPSGQGNAGGNGAPGPTNYQGGGGGGGAGAVGANAVTVTGGNGGNGLANSISGSSVTYAGGGGGGTNEVNTGFGTGGTGGGGRAGYWNGSSVTAAVAGTANLGGGGGGAGSNGATGGAGGSGIVIVRYAV